MKAGNSMEFLNIVEIHLGVPQKNQFYVDCPCCGGKRKLNINIEKGVFRCPRCDVKGGYLALNAILMGYHNPDSLSTDELLKLLFEARGDNRRTYSPSKIPQIKEEPFDYNKVDKAYRKFLSFLSLDKTDEEFLKKKGVKNLKRYKSYKKEVIIPKEHPDFELFLDIPGFIKRPDGNIQSKSFYKGILFPYINIDGKMVSFQIRTNNPKAKYVYFSSSFAGGKSAKASYGVHGDFRGKSKLPTCILTEGGLKADVIRHLEKEVQGTDYNVVSVPGVNSVNELYKDLKKFKDKGIVTFILAFDMDRFSNQFVLKAEKNLYEKLTSEGFKVGVYIWDCDPETFLTKGLDDAYLYDIKGDLILDMKSYSDIYYKKIK